MHIIDEFHLDDIYSEYLDQSIVVSIANYNSVRLKNKKLDVFKLEESGMTNKKDFVITTISYKDPCGVTKNRVIEWYHTIYGWLYPKEVDATSALPRLLYLASHLQI